MLEKVVDIIKNNDIVIPKLLFLNYKKLNINSDELIIITYILNSNFCFDLKKMMKDLDIENKDLLKIINSLIEKDLLEIKVDKNDLKNSETFSLDNLYQKLGFIIINKEETKETTNLFSIFEKEFGRTISPMEYEIINAWKSSDFSDELIILALKEATYNGVSNLRYIDKILHEWRKKGIKNIKDIEQDKQKFNKKNSKNIEMFDYDWLNDNE